MCVIEYNCNSEQVWTNKNIYSSDFTGGISCDIAFVKCSKTTIEGVTLNHRSLLKCHLIGLGISQHRPSPTY